MHITIVTIRGTTFEVPPSSYYVMENGVKKIAGYETKA